MYGERREENGWLTLTNPCKFCITRGVIKFIFWMLNTILISTMIIGLPLFPESDTYQISPIHPLPLALLHHVRQTDPGYGCSSAEKIQLFLGGYNSQVSSSRLTVLSAALPGFRRATSREKVALVLESFPSLEARDTYLTSIFWLLWSWNPYVLRIFLETSRKQIVEAYSMSRFIYTHWR